MRADLSTIQQTLTPEAASVLARSIEEAARRRHGQTTPLHVAASLLSSPSSLFRRACTTASSNSPHPLHCRALELCFSVALDRLPSSSSPSSNCGPPVSNALVAALKRAQAHQRRGGSGLPDTPQPPLLAVKVELEQLILSILDDPSVSRVMREASFNSTAVKSTIENSLLSTSSSSSPSSPSPSTTNIHNPQLGLPQPTLQSSNPNPNLLRSNMYMNPKLTNTGGVQVPAPIPVPVPIPLDATKKEEEVKKVFDIMLRSNKSNPIFVGDMDTDPILIEVIHKLSSGLAPSPMNSAQVFAVDPELSKITELENLLDEKLKVVNSIVINLGDLKWLVENQHPSGRGGTPGVTESARSAVGAITRLLARFNREERKRVWLLGTATCATYLRCQVYHTGMENEWDLQAVPITPPRRPSIQPSLMNPRLMNGGINIRNNSPHTLLSSSPLKSLGLGLSRPIPSMGVIPLQQSNPLMQGSTNSCTQTSMCQICMGGYEREMGKLVAEQFEKSSTNNASKDSSQNLPHWLQIGNNLKSATNENSLQTKDQELLWKSQTEELQKKWRETCTRLHAKKPTLSLHPSLSSSLTGPKLTLSTATPTSRLMPHLKLTPNTQKPTLNLKLNEKPRSPPESPVKTDLSLGVPKFSYSLSDQQKAKIAGIADIDSFKKLLKDLKEKVSWQENAASAISAVVIQCRAGNGKRRGNQPRGDTWLLFVGADKIGKRKMADTLSESLFGGGPVIVRFGSGDKVEPNMGLWGKTVLDRVVEAVRMNPFAIILLEDIDKADTVIRGKIKRAIDRGRLPDTHGREVNLGNVTFILTTSWIQEMDPSHENLVRYEERVLDSADSGSWQLELSVGYGQELKRRAADWVSDETRPVKTRKESGLDLNLNLNLAVGGSADDTCEGSRNSSDLTIEQDRLVIRSAMPSSVSELIESVEEAIVFEPVDFAPHKTRVVDCIEEKFEGILGNECSIKIDDEVIDRMVGGVWVKDADLEEWAEKILRPGVEQLKRNLRLEERKLTVRISTLVRYPRRVDGGGLAEKVVIAVDGA